MQTATIFSRSGGWLLLLVFLVLPAHAQTTQIYWTDHETHTVQRQVGPSGSVETLYTGVDRPEAFVVDAEADVTYFVDDSERGISRLRRASLDGTDQQVLLDDGVITELMLDAEAGVLYWLAEEDGYSAIRRMNTDGTGVIDIYQIQDEFDVTAAQDLALDAAGGWVYFHHRFDDVIRRVKTDGTSVEDVVSGVVRMFDLALSPDGSTLYWSDNRDSISRASTDGSGTTEVFLTETTPRNLTIDPAGEVLYWSYIDATVPEQGVRRALLTNPSPETFTTVATWFDDYVDLFHSGADGCLYWSSEENRQLVRTCSVRGETEVVLDYQNPVSVAVDAETDRLFWLGTDARGNAEHGLFSMDLTSGENVLHRPLDYADNYSGLTLDPAGDGYYFVQRPVLRSGYDAGVAPDTLVTYEAQQQNGAYVGSGVAVDASAGSLYWLTNVSSDLGEIWRSTLEGTQLTKIASGLDYPRGLTLDAETGLLYWAEDDETQGVAIRRADGDGQNVTTVLAGVSDLGNPFGMTVAGDRLYWTDVQNGEIRRSALDGSSVETVVSGLYAPTSVFVVAGDTDTAADEVTGGAQGSILSHPAPNPFSERATFSLEIDRPQQVRVALYDALGRRVATLFEGMLTGDVPHRFALSGGDLPSGVYILRAEGERFAQSHLVTRVR